jgi:hypothetical protein
MPRDGAIVNFFSATVVHGEDKIEDCQNLQICYISPSDQKRHFPSTATQNSGSHGLYLHAGAILLPNSVRLHARRASL